MTCRMNSTTYLYFYAFFSRKGDIREYLASCLKTFFVLFCYVWNLLNFRLGKPSFIHNISNLKRNVGYDNDMLVTLCFLYQYFMFYLIFSYWEKFRRIGFRVHREVLFNSYIRDLWSFLIQALVIVFSSFIFVFYF